MTGHGSEASRRPDTRGISRERQSAPPLHEMYGAPTGQPPYCLKKPRRSPCDVPTKRQMDFDSRVYYHFRSVGGAVWEISAFKREPITKILPSDGCKGGTVLLAVGQWYDFHVFGCHLGNVGLYMILRLYWPRQQAFDGSWTVPPVKSAQQLNDNSGRPSLASAGF